MPKPFRQLTIEQFADEVDRFKFTRKVTGVHMHHTWKPTQADYRGESTIVGMWKFHTQNNGWSDIAQHVSIAPDGTIWTGRDWNVTPASATGFSTGAFMFETIGNFDVGHETLAGEQLRAVIEVIARVQIKHKLPLESLHFHREFTDQKTCPGNGLRKADILALVRARRAEIEGGGTRDFAFDGEAAAQAFSRRSSFFGAAADGGAAVAVAGRAFSESALDREAADEGEVDCGVVPQDEPAEDTRDFEVPEALADDATRGGGRKLALCIGINAYPGNLRLGGCVADAKLWARRLAELGFQVKLLLDAQATRKGMTAAIRQLVEQSRPGDTVVLQYAGHGTHFRDEDSDEGDAQDEALVPVDCNQGGFLLDDEQFALFSRLPEGVSFTCIYDCCHSGTMSRAALQSAFAAAADAEPVRPRFMDPTPEMWEAYREHKAASRGAGAKRGLRDRESNRVVAFSACRDDEVALERGGNGVFTRHVSALVRDAVRSRLSNADFQRRLLAAFPEPSQHPALDAATPNLRRPFLGTGSREAAGGEQGAPPLVAVPSGPSGAAPAGSNGSWLGAFVKSLLPQQREELRELLSAPEAEG